jgi:hypothetical protein
VIGTAVSDPQKIVRIPAAGLLASTSDSGATIGPRGEWGD